MSFIDPPKASNPRARLIAMALGLVLLLGLMRSCHTYMQPGAKQYDADTPPMKVADERANVAAPLADVPRRPELPVENILDFISDDDVNRLKAQELNRIRIALEDGFGWLKTQSHEELAAKAYSRLHWSHEKVMQEPGRWRLQVLHVYGMLLHHEVVELLDMPPGLGKLHKLVLIDARSREACTVLTPLMPEAARSVSDGQGADYLACDGLFLMRHAYQKEEGWKPTPLLLARRVSFASELASVRPYLDPRGDPGEPYTEIRPVRTVPHLDVAFLEEQMVRPPKNGIGYRREGALDYHIVASSVAEEKPAYDHAFAYLYGQDDAALSRGVNPEVNYEALMEGHAAPKWMTGKVAHFEGVAAFVKTYSFPSEQNGVTRIHLLVAHDARFRDPAFTWVLACLNLPEGLRVGDRIEAEGVFLKLFPYRSREDLWHWAPLLATRSVRITEPREPEGFSLLHIFTGVATLALLLGLYWLNQRDSDDLSAMRKRVLARQARRTHTDDADTPDDT